MLAAVLAVVVVGAGATWWQVVDAQRLTSSPDDAANIAAGRRVVRGVIRDRDGRTLAASRRDENGEPYRVYPGEAMSGVIGYASRRYGSAGIERTFDAELTGVRDPDPIQDILDHLDPSRRTKGNELHTSLSLPLQRLAVAQLGKDAGAIVMLDPRTGEVLVDASTPTYDPNLIADPTADPDYFASLREDPAAPLLPRATLGLYTPGSVFKIVTAIAALGSGAITPETRYAEQPPAEKTGLLVDGYRVRDGHHDFTQPEPLALAEATEVSCNIFYALAGLATGGAELVAWAASLGFGAPIPYDLPTETSQVTDGSGNAPGGFVDRVELANAAYGQGEVIVTPIQMALVAAAVANDGVIMRPRVVTAVVSPDGSVSPRPAEVWLRPFGLDVARPVREAMTLAVEGEYGPLFTSGAKVPGVLTAGKSGTAEIGGDGEPHSWFIGFAPADDPQVAIAVVVENGGSGASRAAPIAGRMMRAFFAQAAK
ncbi:MAG: penicillin-binding transpeptidase domain-containing protein [Chloroflexi bacterium]|nr:penicillin-binding transpeptidase domain-containing protein [Chloroflexota bacterium]